jgi:hypothetical protein
LIKCNRCAERREAFLRFFFPDMKAPVMANNPPEKLHAQRTRSGDEWEVVNAKNVVQSNGFDNEFEAAEWISERAKRPPK